MDGRLFPSDVEGRQRLAAPRKQDKASLRLIEIYLDANVSRAGPDQLHRSHVGVPGRFANHHHLAVPDFKVKGVL